jgi:hypothetical protein
MNTPCADLAMQLDIDAVASLLAEKVLSAVLEKNYQGDVMNLVPVWWEKHKNELSPCEQRHALEICAQAQKLIASVMQRVDQEVKEQAEQSSYRFREPQWSEEPSPEYEQWLQALGWFGPVERGV